MKLKPTTLTLTLLTTLLQLNYTNAQAGDRLAEGVRGIITRAPKGMKIDGDLSEFKDAFCTPMEYFNDDLTNRPVQFFFMWDEEALYAGMRTIDAKPISLAGDEQLWNGDGVEWLVDTRRDENFRSQKWSPGSVHCYWAGLKGTNIHPRFCLSQDGLSSIEKIGVEVAAKRTKVGLDVEFKLPWVNFPNFKPALNAVIGLDAEATYSDGGGICFRSFIYGSPLDVQQPASQSKVQLVEKMIPAYWKACGLVLTPIRCDTEWLQSTKAMVTAYMALPPNRDDQIGSVAFRLVGLNGKTIAEFPGKMEVFEAEGNFQRATAQWPNDLAMPGTFQLLGIVYDKSHRELTRVAPHLVSINMKRGY